MHYSDHVSPYVLRCVSQVTDSTGKAVSSKTEMDTVAVNIPGQVLGQAKPTSRTKTVHENTKGKTITWEVQCADVPGGVVSHALQEFDPAGRLVRTDSLELLDYAAAEYYTRPGKPIRRPRFWRRRRY